MEKLLCEKTVSARKLYEWGSIACRSKHGLEWSPEKKEEKAVNVLLELQALGQEVQRQMLVASVSFY